MEKMPYRPDVPLRAGDSVPVLTCKRVTLRELRASDAPTLFALLTAAEVARFISPPPATLEGFERFISWAGQPQTLRAHVSFGVALEGQEHAIGLFQVRALEPGFATAEWGFAIGSSFWGTGVFLEGAALVLDFAFDTLGVRRLEARAVVSNGRGNGALRKTEITGDAGRDPLTCL